MVEDAASEIKQSSLLQLRASPPGQLDSELPFFQETVVDFHQNVCAFQKLHGLLTGLHPEEHERPLEGFVTTHLPLTRRFIPNHAGWKRKIL